MAVALVLALALWVTPFAVWPSAPPRPVQTALRPPVVRFLGTFQGVDRTAWSPVVFPLPTKYGFSETADMAGGGHDMAALMRPQAFEGVFLEGAPPAVETAALGTLDEPGIRKGYRPAAPAGDVFRTGGRKPATGWTMDMDEVLRGRGFLADLAGVGVPPAGQGNVDAYVELDLRGCPLHVLLEGTTGNPGLDATIVRALYAGRSDRGAEGFGGRVRLFHRGPAGGRAGGGVETKGTGETGDGARSQQGR